MTRKWKTALALTIAVFTLSLAPSGKAAPEGFCATDSERCWKGQGAEAWHWKAVQAERKLRVRWRPTVFYAYRLASTVTGVPYWQLRSVGSCESHHHPFARNLSSSASGVMQFLVSTWNRTAMARAGFSVFDPVANVMAAAVIVAQQGWRQWSCRP